MLQNSNSKKIYERLPMYLDFIGGYEAEYISSTVIAKQLNLGEVQVRKDLALVSGKGKPKVGYSSRNLISDIKKYMGFNELNKVIIVGFGKLGRALYEYPGFQDFGIEISQAFDVDDSADEVMNVKQLKAYCQANQIHFGVITVPKDKAQEICDLMIESGILGIWNFTSTRLKVPSDIIVQNVNLATSLSILLKETVDNITQEGECHDQ